MLGGPLGAEANRPNRRQRRLAEMAHRGPLSGRLRFGIAEAAPPKPRGMAGNLPSARRSGRGFSGVADYLAERVGFEPTVPFGTHAFQACALKRRFRCSLTVAPGTYTGAHGRTPTYGSCPRRPHTCGPQRAPANGSPAVTFNPRVGGSSPPRPTKDSGHLAISSESGSTPGAV